MERGTESILQYQLSIETILTRRMRWFLPAPGRWSENTYSGTSLSCILTFIHAAFSGQTHDDVPQGSPAPT